VICKFFQQTAPRVPVTSTGTHPPLPSSLLSNPNQLQVLPPTFLSLSCQAAWCRWVLGVKAELKTHCMPFEEFALCELLLPDLICLGPGSWVFFHSHTNR